MKKIIIITMILTTQIFAQLKGGVGVGYKNTNSIYDKVGNQVTTIPIIYLSNKQYYIQGTKFGKHLYFTKRFKINAGIYIDSNSIYRDKNKDFKNMNKINKRINANFHIINKNKNYNYLFNLNIDISNNSKGFDFTTQISKDFKFSKLSIEPKLGIIFNDKKTNNYLYGITSTQANLNYAKYTAKSSFSPYLELDINYKFFKFLGLKSNIKYTKISNTIYNSPMLSKDKEIISMIALVFYFKL